jgi:hypothetical protein
MREEENMAAAAKLLNQPPFRMKSDLQLFVATPGRIAFVLVYDFAIRP